MIQDRAPAVQHKKAQESRDAHIRLPTAAFIAAVKSPVCRIPPHCAHAAGMNFLLDTSLGTHQDGHPTISALIRNQALSMETKKAGAIP